MNNFLPDYFSLVFSRTILKRMARNPTGTRIVILLVLDTLGTALIATCALWLSGRIAQAVTSVDCIRIIFRLPKGLQPWAGKVRHALAIMTIHLFFGEADFKTYFSLALRFHHPLSVLFYSAFLTSIWIWLYVASAVLIKIAHRVRPLWLKAFPYLDVERRPMQAIGRIAGIMAGIGYCILLVAQSALRH